MDFNLAENEPMPRIATLFVVLVFGLTSLAGSKKKPEMTIRFFAEVAENNGDTFGTTIPLLDGSGEIRVSKVATVSERDIEAFSPFQNPDGSIGVNLHLDDHGRLLLETLSMEQRGKILVALVNGRHVCDLMIDKRITDGIAVIPTGLAPEDIASMRKKLKMRGPGADINPPR